MNLQLLPGWCFSQVLWRLSKLSRIGLAGEVSFGEDEEDGEERSEDVSIEIMFNDLM